MLTSFSFSTDARSPSSSFGMPQHASFSTSAYGISLCSSSLTQVVADARLVVVDVAGREDRDLARRALRRRAPATRATARRVVAERASSRTAAARPPRRCRASSPSPCARDGVRLAVFTICTTTGIVASLPRRSVPVRSRSRNVVSPSRNFFALRAQHQVREVDVPRMRRNVRALRHVAEVAQVALVDDLPVVGLGDAVDLHRLALVDEVEQRRERAAQAARSGGSRGRCRRRAPSPCTSASSS